MLPFIAFYINTLLIDIFHYILYYLVMINNDLLLFTPEEVAKILKVSKGTVYQLISRGEILAKRLGNTYRIPRHSISFAFEGLDGDILEGEKIDRENLKSVHTAIKSVRKSKK
jgi:excisionase family DNA binding protein